MALFKRVFKSEKTNPSNLLKTIELTMNSDEKIVKWHSSIETKRNFGDALNPWLFEKITGNLPINSSKIFNFKNRPVYSCIGSILDNNSTKNLVVWGSGFKEKGNVFQEIPQKIFAVRGPLSRNNILDQGIECPEIYGDPALLLPKFYNPNITKKYKLGIVAHYVDKQNKFYLQLIDALPNDILVIDIENTIENVVDDILQCESIASSSLHGIIVSDAYKIPSIQLKFSENVIGDNFKFKDYMASVNREYMEPIIVDYDTSLNNILNSFSEYTININIDELYEVCPFKLNN